MQALCDPQRPSATMKTEATLLLGLEAGFAGVELFVGQLESVVFTVEGDAPDRHDLIATQIAAATGRLLRIPSRLDWVVPFGLHRSFLPRRSGLGDSPRPNIADLEAKLARCIGAELVREGREDLGLAQLELLRPDRALDRELEHLAADADRSAMGRDLLTDDRSPDLPDPVGLRDGIESKVAEHLAHHVGERRRPAASPRGPGAHEDRDPGWR